MLREIRNARQVSSEHPKRWFTDEDMDLVVWFGDDHAIVEFQLAYDKSSSEHALTWRQQSGFQHNGVDDGEGRPGSYKASPLLVPDGEFSAAAIAERFKDSAIDIDADVSNFVYSKLLECSADQSTT